MNQNNSIELDGADIFDNWNQLMEQPTAQKSELDDGLMDSLMSDEKGQEYWIDLFQRENFAGMDLITLPYKPFSLNEIEFHQKFSEIKRLFLQDLTKNYINDLRSADLSEESIFYLGKGILPANWTVHLKFPLLYGGKLDLDNLILMPEHPFHELIHNFLNQQILSAAGVAHTKNLYVPVPPGKVYINSGDFSGSGGKATSDRSVMAGMTTAALQQLSIKTGGR